MYCNQFGASVYPATAATTAAAPVSTPPATWTTVATVATPYPAIAALWQVAYTPPAIGAAPCKPATTEPGTMLFLCWL
jgi:hypothetical protein